MDVLKLKLIFDLSKLYVFLALGQTSALIVLFGKDFGAYRLAVSSDR